MFWPDFEILFNSEKFNCEQKVSNKYGSKEVLP